MRKLAAPKSLKLLEMKPFTVKSLGGGLKKAFVIKGLNGKPQEVIEDVASYGAALDRFESDMMRANMARLRYDAQNDFGFWFGVYFKTRQQKDAFLAGMGYQVGEDGDDTYIDGRVLARIFEIELPEAPPLNDHPPDKRWAAMAREEGEE